MPFALDIHGHSRASYDSLLDPRTVIRCARSRGLHGIAITDHETIQGALETQRANPYPDFLVIVGVEIRTELGDVVGLFLTEEIPARTFDAVADAIHAQGGLVLLPHPGKRPTDPLIPHLHQIDLIETWNARSKPKWNAVAAAFAARHGKPEVANSDAHSWFEIARAYTVLENATPATIQHDLLHAPRTLVKGQTNFYLSHVASVLTERWKRRQS